MINHTKSFQSQVIKVINNSKTLTPSDKKCKHMNMSPTASSIKGLIKLNKPEHPIRPVVNWRGAPAYKLAHLFTQKIKQMAPLPNTYNLQNTRDLIKKLEDTPVLPHFALDLLDITNLYTNIPVKEIREIIAKTLEKNQIEVETRHGLLNWYDAITKQNYISNNGKILIQQDGLAMGAPTSGKIAEFFLQSLEDTHLTHLSIKHKIARYFRYVDDILIIYDPNHTDVNNMRKDFNTTHPIMKCLAETEFNKKINYLDITIHRSPTNWVISIYRKPTFIDTIISYSSNHPAQHTYAAIRFLYNRLNTYNLHKSEYKEEINTIHDIMLNNGFLIHTHTHTHTTPTHRHPTTTSDRQTDSATHK